MSDEPQVPPAPEEPRPAEIEVPAEFREAVSELLYHSQMIEAWLRTYLAEVYKTADLAIQARGVRFKLPLKPLRKKPLGPLIEMFSHHTDNDELVTRLKAFVEHRNEAAHSAFVWAWLNSEKPEDIAQAIERVRVNIEEARRLEKALRLEELKALLALRGEQLHQQMDEDWRAGRFRRRPADDPAADVRERSTFSTEPDSTSASDPESA